MTKPMTTASGKKKSPPRYPCGLCKRKFRAEQMVYLRFTGNRYCRPGVGCQKGG